MNTTEFWHVVWTTYGCWKPNDKRGNWESLGDFYTKLGSEFSEIRFSHPLPNAWMGSEFRQDYVHLNDGACAQIDADIRQLSVIEGDRVAGNTPVFGISVEPTCVQLVLSCDFNELSQKVGRLKSRTATLLSFVPENEAGGKNTWGKGFWYACFHDERVVSRVVAFVGAAYA